MEPSRELAPIGLLLAPSPVLSQLRSAKEGMSMTTKRATKKSRGLRKPTSIESVKPLSKSSTPATTPSENLSLSYGGVQWTYTPQK